MKKQAFALIFSNGINFLVNFAMNPFLARQLSYDDNATYGQINLINVYATILFGLGMAYVINILLVENKNKENSLLSAVFLIQCISGFVCISALFLCHHQLSALFNNPEMGQYLVQNLPSTFLIILTNLAAYYYIYFNKAYQLSVITVLLNVIKLALVFYAVNVLESLFYVIVFLNITNLLQFLVYVWGLRKRIFPLVKPHLPKIRYIIRLSYPYLGMSLIGYSILCVGGIIVSNQLGTKDFAIYRNGAIEIPFFATLYSSITSIAMPQIVVLTKERRIRELVILKKKISNTVAALIYPVVFFCIINGDVFMELYLGNKYLESGIIFSIYNIAVLIRINAYSDILTINKKPKKIMISNLAALASSIIVTFLLIQIIGPKGAAIAFLISMLLMSGLLVYNSCKEMGIRIYDYFDFVNIGKIAAICVVGSVISIFFIKVDILSFAITGAVYATLVYFYMFKLNLVDSQLLPVKVQKLTNKMGRRWSVS
jgi:O-antigen/teichoic acid export membrane protein